MQNEKSFVGGYKFNEFENKNKDIDGFLSDVIINASYPANSLIQKIKDKQNSPILENMGVPAGLVLSVPKLVPYNEYEHKDNNNTEKKGGLKNTIPDVIPDTLFDKLFGLVSSNTKPKGSSINSKTKKLRK